MSDKATQIPDDEVEEAAAFNRRIEERVNSGFIPDVRRAVKCEYFYKSFWRDPHFVELYETATINVYLRMLREFGGTQLRILDVGCGAGYVSLELARAGHHVVAIDIAESCIRIARETLATNPFKEGFGSLAYQVLPFRNVNGTYDVVLFSGVLHHSADPGADIERALELLVPNGLILTYEPCHDQWRLNDAAQVALIRILLSLTGHWYETFDSELTTDKSRFEAFVNEIHQEYVNERDKDEAGQSPHDNASTGAEILAQLRKHLSELEYKPGFSFIYRVLGGLRGKDELVFKIADFLALYEQLSVESGYMRPNGFFFIGRKPNQS